MRITLICLVWLRLTVAGSVDLRIYQSRWFYVDGHPTGGRGVPMEKSLGGSGGRGSYLSKGF